MAVERIEPQPSADERTTLVEFLDWYRATIETKLEGLDDEQARIPIPPSDMTLIGIVRHLAEVERSWFRARFRGEDVSPLYYSDADPDGDFHAGPSDTAAGALAAYRAECDHARAITNAQSLDDLSAVKLAHHGNQQVSLRWILVHMIEETARHAGHADLLRETIDGVTGD
ncbi:MAG: Mini-circle protein [Actinomycetia bacterium]|nr:Mini-circle protein [Actinomycetes bacterium]